MLMKCKLHAASILVMRTIQENCVEIIISVCKRDSAKCSIDPLFIGSTALLHYRFKTKHSFAVNNSLMWNLVL